MNDGPTCVSLFSGIGGMDYGLHRAGFRHLAFCESDAYRRDVLAARWPGVPVYDDVATFGAADVRLAGRRRDGQDVGWQQVAHLDRGPARADTSSTFGGDARGVDSPDLLCGGFPCQDLSVAGQRRGLDGDRSGLFFQFARIAGTLRPRWLLVENVPGLLSSQGGRDFGTVLGTLADLGYGVAWRVLDSRFFGVPQRRRRVFVVGALADGDSRAAAERAGKILAVGARCQGHPATRGETREDVAVASLSGLGTGGPDDNDGQGGRLVANGLVKRYGKVSDSDATDTLVHGFHMLQDPISEQDLAPAWGKGNKQGTASIGVQTGASVRRLMPVECERLQALPDGWTELGGTADSKRYAALGDAVTSAVAQWIGGRIIDAEHLALRRAA